MDIARAFTFITEDEDYMQKLAVGVGVIIISSVLSIVLIGILGFIILAGYGLRLLENVRDDVEKPLPAWDDWGGDLSRGFKYMVVTFVWGIPIMLFTIPMVLGGILADSGGAGEFFGTSILLCGGCLVFLYGVFLAVAQPAFAISFARDERIGSGLMLTEIWTWVQQNLGQVVIAGLVVIGVGIIVSSLAMVLGALICGIGLLVTIPLGTLLVTIFQHHLYGQLARSYPMYPAPRAGATVATMPAAPLGAPDSAPIVVSTESTEVLPADEVSSDIEPSTDENASDTDPQI